MGWRRWRGARGALPGRRWDPPWPFVAPPPPETPAQWSRPVRLPAPAAAVRRGQVWNPPWPHPSPRNRFEGTDEATITVANSGGASGDPWNSISAAQPPVYDTAQIVTGISSMRAAVAAGTVSATAWDILFGPRATYYGRIYVRWSSLPPAIVRLSQQESQGGGAVQWGLGLDTAGHVIVRDLVAGATRFTSTAIPAAGTWHRLEWQAVWDGTNTTVTVRLFLGGNLHGVAPDEEGASTAFAQAVQAGQYRFGVFFSTAQTWDAHLDDAGLDANTWIGPSGSPPPFGNVGSRVSHVLAAGWARLAHGRRWHAPPTAAAPEVSVWTPTWVGSRSSWRLPLRRGRWWTPPVAEPPPAPSAWTVTGVGTRARWAASQPRGVRWSPPWPTTAPPPPEPPPLFVQARRQGPAARRQGRQWAPPWQAPWVPPGLQGTRPRSWPQLHRGVRRWSPPWPDAGAVAPGVWLPGFRRHAGTRPRVLPPPRRGQLFSPPWPQGEQFIGAVPRFVEGGTTAVGLLEGAGGGAGYIEGGTAGVGVEGTGGGTGQVEGTGGGGTGQVEGGGSI